MPHPQMFADDDPFLARVREVALGFPGADEKVSHGRPAFFTRKVFCYYGAAVREHGAWTQHPCCLVVLLDTDERAAVLTGERSFVPAYLGRSGWLGIDLADAAAVERGDVTGTDWGEVAELLDASYRRTAGARWVAALDAGTDG